MFFAEKISAVKSNDKVLEIGPGATPHFRSNVFLELELSEGDRLRQRGNVVEEPSFGDRPVFFYGGSVFPFKDNEFDYVICSHVIEHVEDPESFLAEVFRVGGGKGYIEYPLVTYEFLYNFKVHLNFVKLSKNKETLVYLPKNETNLNDFYPINQLFYRTLENGWNELCTFNQDLFFEGFEFDKPFQVEKASSLKELAPSMASIQTKTSTRNIVDRVLSRLGVR